MFQDEQIAETGTDDEVLVQPSADSPVSSWQEAETLAAWHMRELGFVDAGITGAGTDGGIDVTASGAVAQVKHYAKAPVGAPAVQQLRGAALNAEWALFYAWSGYTKAAITFADAANVALFRYEDDATVVAVNDVAAFLLRSRHLGAARPERFQLERTAQALMQVYGDKAAEAFFAVVGQACARAEALGPSTPVFLAAQVELQQVKSVIHQLGDGTHDLTTFTALVEQINEARRRLERDLAH